MALGFRDDTIFKPLIGWELYQVTIDKYHVMFYFNNGWALLNVAYKFALKSPEKDKNEYEIYGDSKLLHVDPILRKEIRAIKISSIDQLDIQFSNNYVLEIYDDPDICSWWGFGGRNEKEWKAKSNGFGDREPDLLTDEEIEYRKSATVK